MDEYPKMLTKKNDKGGIEPVYYPPGHEKQGTVVVFENEHEKVLNISHFSRYNIVW